jgi:uncharacterized membrane protein
VTTYELLLFLHLLGVFGLVGAAGVSTAVGIRAGRTTEPMMIAFLLDMQHRTEWFVTLPAGALTVIAGSLLVDEAGFEYDAGWIESAYTLFIIVVALDFLVLLRRNRKVRAQAQTLIDTGTTHSDALRRTAGAPLFIALGALLDVSFIAFLYLMVAKPGM